MRYRVLLGWAVLWSAGCRGGADMSAPAPPPKVTIAEVLTNDLAEWDEYQGEFEAIDAVDVRPRVSGPHAGVLRRAPVAGAPASI